LTRIDFHFNVADRSAYACRLLRKAARTGARVAVTAPAEQLAALDRELWAFEATEFVPHVRLEPGQELPERLRPTPICLLEDATAAPHHEVLLNLGAAAPAGFESYARLIEIVSTDAADRQAGRARWKHYADRGYALEAHEVQS
jgi:DNA polymerase-3 subunit chi